MTRNRSFASESCHRYVVVGFNITLIWRFPIISKRGFPSWSLKLRVWTIGHENLECLREDGWRRGGVGEGESYFLQGVESTRWTDAAEDNGTRCFPLAGTNKDRVPRFTVYTGPSPFVPVILGNEEAGHLVQEAVMWSFFFVLVFLDSSLLLNLSKQLYSARCSPPSR